MKPLAPALAVLIGTLCAAAANPAAAALERAATSAQRATRPCLRCSRRPNKSCTPGDRERASTFLERALQLEPRNPTVWHYLGVTRLDLGNYAQAEAMAAEVA